MTYVLGYWKIRGLAAHIRLLCAYTGTPLEEEFYEDRDTWLAKKETLEDEYAFINLPYFYKKGGDGPKLTQSTAILRYLGRKHDLCGKTEDEIQSVDMVFDELRDVSTMFGRMCYNPDFGPELKKTFLESVPAKLKRLDKYFTSEFAAGSAITIADFQAWHTLEALMCFEPTLLDDYPNLKSYVERFEAIPAIKAHMESDAFLHWPLNGTPAKWGGPVSGPEDPRPPAKK